RARGRSPPRSSGSRRTGRARSPTDRTSRPRCGRRAGGGSCSWRLLPFGSGRDDVEPELERVEEAEEAGERGPVAVDRDLALVDLLVERGHAERDVVERGARERQRGV